MMRALSKTFGSFGLACVLLLCLFVLTLFGTLYQVDHGLYDAKQTYFHSWFLKTDVGIPYFPGGILVMLLLTINLIVGGIVRLKWQARNVGILIVHFGMVFMFVSGLVKLVTAEEGHLQLFEGDQSDRFVSAHLWEVEITELDGSEAMPQWILADELITDLVRGAEREIRADDLPFTLRLSNFLENCEALPKGPNWDSASEVIDGFGLMQYASEKEDERNLAGLTVAVEGSDGEEKRALLWAGERAPWTVQVEGRLFTIGLDRAKYPMPFTIRLDKFTKEDHPGISMAKAYKSDVTRIDEAGERPVLIQMNEPLREGGLVLFQSSFGPSTPGHEGPFFSVFSVVRNPSDKWPEYSLWVITVGLVLAFGRRLLRFIKQQTKHHAATAGESA